MHPNEIEDRFIGLRAQGWNLPRIATEIHIDQLPSWIGATMTTNAVSARFLRRLTQFYFCSLVNQRLTKTASSIAQFLAKRTAGSARRIASAENSPNVCKGP